MRRIIIFDQSEYSIKNNTALNIAAEIARNKKKVLFMDLRYKENFTIKGINEEYIKQRNIYHCMNQNMNIKRNIISLEENLHIIPGSIELPKIEFNLYYELMKHNYFERRIKDNEYDYIFMVITPILSQININAISFSTEAISIIECSPNGYDYQEKMNRFTHYMKRFYGKEIFFSNIIPYYDSFLDEETYNLLTSEMTSLLVTPPFSLKDKASIERTAAIIMQNENKFDISKSKRERQRYIDEYYNIQQQDKSLEEYEKIIK